MEQIWKSYLDGAMIGTQMPKNNVKYEKNWCKVCVVRTTSAF